MREPLQTSSSSAFGASSRTPGRIRAFLLASSPLMGETLARALATEPRIELVGSGLLRSCSFAALRASSADVFLIDAAMQGPEAREQIREICDESLPGKCLALGIQPEDAVDFVESGAAGFTLPSESFAAVGRAIQDVVEGRVCCPPSIAFQVLSRLRCFARERADRNVGPLEELSSREREVLHLLVRGLRNKEIAGQLNIAAATVRNHIQKIFGKLNVHRRADAVRLAFERGLVLEAGSL